MNALSKLERLILGGNLLGALVVYRHTSSLGSSLYITFVLKSVCTSLNVHKPIPAQAEAEICVRGHTIIWCVLMMRVVCLAGPKDSTLN